MAKRDYPTHLIKHGPDGKTDFTDFWSRIPIFDTALFENRDDAPIQPINPAALTGFVEAGPAQREAWLLFERLMLPKVVLRTTRRVPSTKRGMP